MNCVVQRIVRCHSNMSNTTIIAVFDCIYRYLWSYQHNGVVSPERCPISLADYSI